MPEERHVSLQEIRAAPIAGIVGKRRHFSAFRAMLAFTDITPLSSNVGESRQESAMWVRVKGSRHLGEALEQVRRGTGLTQAELAERLDVTRTTVIDMEKGRPAAIRRLVDWLSILGYDLVIVPRGARVTVVEQESAR
jgi:DNA-binding transcriptional regulator YiaG